ncbi:TetR family transcriptional regulator [Blastococcus sp. TBT05-19]|uniref:TetR/AcrR family transcriptional regulator n=1 Tax=Blastococcus sp. TBT05-19 TaxID=2250581 RepID=UPI000DEA43AF|nr:TetR family transcriptional regulator C-terminal domain-containing protein [Blastococcus sp. TBT05-19]RBY94703.1 TetR family transcriptional regulator [Blastococcus sp. TBT05-19]
MQSTQRTRIRKTPDGRRAEIAVAARAMALEEGLQSVTQRAVAGQASIAPALVAHYVGSMDELVAETFEAIVGDELDEVAALLEAMPDPLARIAGLIETLLGGSRHDVTLVWVQAWSAGRRNEALADAVRRQMDNWQALIRDVIDEGVEASVFRCDDPAGAAWHLLAMVDGLNAHALVRWGAPAAQETAARRAAEALLGLDAGSLARTAEAGTG